MVSFPAVLKQAVNIIWEKLQAANVKDDFVCGVPYTALPIASILSGQFEVRVLNSLDVIFNQITILLYHRAH
jgi:orotate phosphoribosyltransferase